MTNLIIASFNEEAEAIEAAHKMHELETIGDITVFEMLVVKKNADGELDVLQTDTAEGLTTVSGMAVGTLIGALGGPVGMIAGMFAGTLTGAAVEADRYGFAEDFVADATGHLEPSQIALIAEIEESDPVFVDSSLTPMGATIIRSDVDYEYTRHSAEEIDELDDEIAAAREKIKSAAEKEKARIQQKIAKLKEERKESIAEFKEKMKDAVADIKTSARERKLEKLRSKIEKHHKKIAELEHQVEAFLEKDKDTQKEVEA
jgi:uncharacterized membrane protein